MSAAPFFETTAGVVTPRRLVLISYHFPPGPSAGALRWQKLAGLAAERGWGLDVFTADPAGLGRTDDARLDDLPGGVRVFGVPEFPGRMDAFEEWAASALRRIRSTGSGGRGPASPQTGANGSAGGGEGGQSLMPEEITWWPRSRRDLLRAYWAIADSTRWNAWADAALEIARSVVDPARHAAVISCGPPHSAHDAGRRLARETGLPFVMDMRDPWAIRRRLIERVAHPIWFHIAARTERRAVRAANLVVTNTAAVTERMRAAYPARADRIITVTNGYDEDEPRAIEPAGRFTATYAGAIYLDRDPRPLFQAAAIVVKELELAPEDFAIELIGKVTEYEGEPVRTLAERAGVAEYVHTRGAVPRDELFSILASASMLVSLPQDSPWAIPSKIFEYMQFDAWMLVFADAGSPIEELLRGSAADVVAPGDVAHTARVLRERVLAFRSGTRPTRLGVEPRFSRRYQADVLFSAIEGITGPSSHPAPALLP